MAALVPVVTLSRRYLFVIIGVVVIFAAVIVAVWGWGVLVEYINPKAATERKDTVQVYALIVAGVVGLIGAGVGLANVYFSRMNLQHNQEALERQVQVAAARSQDAALQAYYEQIGKLLIEHDLRKSEIDSDFRLLAEAQTNTVLRELDPARKAQLLVFLERALLIHKDDMAVNLARADLRNVVLRNQLFSEAVFDYVDFSGADLRESDFSLGELSGATFVRANLQGASFRHAHLGHADFTGANLTAADLTDAVLTGANLSNAKGLTDEQLHSARSLTKAIMPDGSQHPDRAEAEPAPED